MELPDHLGGSSNITHIDLKTFRYLKDEFNVKTMIDIGCGPGGMVKIANDNDIDCIGIDGDYEVEKVTSNIIIHDFNKGICNNKKLKQQYDLGWSCEFVEHVKEKYIPNYFNIFRRCKVILMSFNENKNKYHLNIRPFSYWNDLFNAYNFIFDKERTEYIRRNSSMKRKFIKERGCLFINKRIING